MYSEEVVRDNLCIQSPVIDALLANQFAIVKVSGVIEYSADMSAKCLCSFTYRFSTSFSKQHRLWQG